MEKINKEKNFKFNKKIFQAPKYKGKHIVMVAGKVFTASTGKEAIKIFDRVTKKYPDKIPIITYIPKEDSLIFING